MRKILILSTLLFGACAPESPLPCPMPDGGLTVDDGGASSPRPPIAAPYACRMLRLAFWQPLDPAGGGTWRCDGIEPNPPPCPWINTDTFCDADGFDLCYAAVSTSADCDELLAAQAACDPTICR